MAITEEACVRSGGRDFILGAGGGVSAVLTYSKGRLTFTQFENPWFRAVYALHALKQSVRRVRRVFRT